MKVLILVTLLLRSSWSLTFSEYKVLFNKTYDGLENLQRESIFNIQSNLILNHQNMFRSARESYTVDFNHITDTGFNDKFRKSFEALPNDMDLPTGEGVVIYRDLVPDSFHLEIPPTEILDQTKNGNWSLMGNCNWGWAFAASKAVEVFLYNNLKARYTIVLSPQQFIDCLPCQVCKKGLPHLAFQYMTEDHQNLYPENTYRYTGIKSKCVPKQRYYPESGSMKGFSILPEVATNEDVKSVLYHLRTPIVFEINPNSEGFMNYMSGIFRNPAYSSFPGSHFMVIVGYDSEVDETGKTVSYWRTMNSFGSNWGEMGFMRIDRNVPLKKLVFPVGI